ncbi:hypothetical protein ABK905_09200 [Acerihabitans sp. KWT182]|uniref:DUF551 domain-containing protein n=1 Tax=Acerihabitans sp. KWT182 TaxID=3157919 RepID=A0AAU7QFL9_9GAMM
MSRYTYVVEYPDGQEPAVNSGMQVAGGRLVAMNFSDALAEPIARPLSEWKADDRTVVWWYWENGEWAAEPAWIGRPTDSDWPGYHTHWTPHPIWPAEPATSSEAR